MVFNLKISVYVTLFGTMAHHFIELNVQIFMLKLNSVAANLVSKLINTFISCAHCMCACVWVVMHFRIDWIFGIHWITQTNIPSYRNECACIYLWMCVSKVRVTKGTIRRKGRNKEWLIEQPERKKTTKKGINNKCDKTM